MHPFDVVKIGRSAFMKCCQLAEVVILPAAAASMGRGLHTLGESAFRECTSLRSMNIPSHPVKGLHNTFWGCTKLTKVILPNILRELKGYVFYNIVNHWHTSTFLPLYKKMVANRSWGRRICLR